MYPIEKAYSKSAYEAWLRREHSRLNICCPHQRIDLRDFRQDWREIDDSLPWVVDTWDDLRTAISFLTLMNKRSVLYYRGQGGDPPCCSPMLLRDGWSLNGSSTYVLGSGNRGWYFETINELRGPVLEVARRVGTPRTYILERIPAAAAAILQHYELWPTTLIDLTRSLAVAVAFAERSGDGKTAWLYAFLMPDLRGSVTSDLDQHVLLARLEAICPPAAKRPHHQDAYLVSRFPEPSRGAIPGDDEWDDWQRQTNLKHRLVAKFKLALTDGRLAGTPPVAMDYLMPPTGSNETVDAFGAELKRSLMPVMRQKMKVAPGA